MKTKKIKQSDFYNFIVQNKIRAIRLINIEETQPQVENFKRRLVSELADNYGSIESYIECVSNWFVKKPRELIFHTFCKNGSNALLKNGTVSFELEKKEIIVVPKKTNTNLIDKVHAMQSKLYEYESLLNDLKKDIINL